MTVTAKSSNISRRRLLGAALTTGFVFAFRLPVGAAVTAQKDAADTAFTPNAFIRIDGTAR